MTCVLAHAFLIGVTLAAQLVLAWHGVADRWLSTVPQPPPRIDLARVFGDPTPMTVTVTGAAGPAEWRTTVEDVRTSPSLWQRMHVADWSRVPDPLRQDALDRMLRTYRQVLNQPAVWDRMSIYDWDAVPQPVRIVAFRSMVAYWSGFYRVGRDYGLDGAEVTRALAAIVMSESWFNHRARSRNADGGDDVGLGQASPYARARLCRLHERGRVDICLTDEDYLNPWPATRFVAIWMTQLLDETGGDLERAIRAYNRGIRAADDRLGRDYGAVVERRLARFIRNEDAPAAWDYLWRQSRAFVVDAEVSAASPPADEIRR
jgi:hypothetical protein